MSIVFSSSPPPPFDKDENRKLIPSFMHKIIHAREIMVNKMRNHLTAMDYMLYSEETRTAISNSVGNPELKSWLMHAESTRHSVYRYHLKGGNSLFLIVEYLQTKYGILANSSVPVLPEGDWDTSLFINPAINNDDFRIIIDILIPRVLKVMVDISHDISTIDYKYSVETALENAEEILKLKNLSEYLEYNYVFSKDKMRIGIANMSDESVETLRHFLGKSGTGTYISSNPKPFEGAEFYLARILANVFAKRKSDQKQVRLPVEIFDFSIPYKSIHLTESWEAYSEYHVQYNEFDFRVLSPVAMYYDLIKCMDKNKALSRTNKFEKRARRLKIILREIIIPYSQHNHTIQNNIRRHTRSRTHVGNIVRNMVQQMKDEDDRLQNIITYE